MIILRQKQYATGVERVQARQALDTVGKRPVKNMNLLSLKTRAKIARGYRNAVNSGIDVVNNPAGAVTDLGKDLVSRPMNTAGKIAIAIPFPASVPAGVGVIAVGDQINKRVKPLRKLSDSINSGIERSGVYRKIKGINLGLVSSYPYKDRRAK